MKEQAELLIVGAGPFGLSLAAHAGDLGIDTLVAGKPMEFWKTYMSLIGRAVQQAAL